MPKADGMVGPLDVVADERFPLEVDGLGFGTRGGRDAAHHPRRGLRRRRTIRKLATMAAAGKVYGLDYSEVSVAVAKKTNAPWIASGRVALRQGSVSQIPFPNHTFDLVTAVETHYFWPDLPAGTRGVLRVLKAGGRFLLIAEVYRGPTPQPPNSSKNTASCRAWPSLLLRSIANCSSMQATATFES
jgi:ubiquinone/menaquinone biosynthesis C-methylase UbiE